MENPKKKPPEELKEIADMRRGRDLTKLREEMLRQTEQGVEELMRDDEKDKKPGA